MFNRLTDCGKRVLTVAQFEAGLFGRPKIGTEHLLLALMIEANGAAGRILRHFDIREDSLRRAIVDNVRLTEHDGKLMFTPNAHASLELALREAIKSRGSKGQRVSVDTEDLLLGIILQSDCSAVCVLQALQVDVDNLLAVTKWAATGIERRVVALVQSGQAEEAQELLQHGINSMEAVLGRARALRDDVVSVVARGAV